MLEATTRSIPLPWFVVAWVVACIAGATSGVLAHVPPLAPVFVVGSVAGAVLAYRTHEPFRSWVDQLPMQLLVGLHVARIPIGIMFLWQHAHGRLPATFAVRGGVGDIAIGALAIAVTFAFTRRRRAVVAFSLLGLADILVVAVTGMYLFLVAGEPLMTAALTSPIYGLLPFGVVPIVIASHLAVLARR